MPGRDGTGPAGAGRMSGRGLGGCAPVTAGEDMGNADRVYCGLGRRMRMGGRGRAGRMGRVRP